MSIFMILGLLVCIIEAQGPNAVTPEFVQKGEDVTLNVDTDVAKDFYSVEWKFNKTNYIIRFPYGRNSSVSPDYIGRIEFLEKKFSVKLKNLKKADSGLYTAKVLSPGKDQTTEYNIIVQGPSAVTPVFVQKGEDVTLNVDADVPEVFYFVEWRFNKTDIIVRFPSGINVSVSPNYTGRLEFLEKKFSVKLRNLQEADSGLYTARVTLALSDRTLAEYSFIVQDPVSPVNLTVVSVDSRSSECNFNVTCRTRDSHINSTFRCIHQTCSQEGGEQSEVTASGASLHLYLSSRSIICNHSNQVSWTKDIKIIEKVCLQSDGSESPPAGISACLLKVVVFSVGLIIMVSAVITVHLMEKLKKHK